LKHREVVEGEKATKNTEKKGGKKNENLRRGGKEKERGKGRGTSGGGGVNAAKREELRTNVRGNRTNEVAAQRVLKPFYNADASRQEKGTSRRGTKKGTEKEKKRIWDKRGEKTQCGGQR